MINPIKSHQNRMRNDQVISVNMSFLSKFNEPLSWWWRHKIGFVSLHIINPTKLHEDWIINNPVIVFTSLKCGIFVRNQWTVKAVMTSSWLYSCIINPTRFRCRVDEKCLSYRVHKLLDYRQTLWLQYPSFPSGKKKWMDGTHYTGVYWRQSDGERW